MKKSFTLIELLIVIAIIGILSFLVIARFTTGRQSANNAKRVQEANGLVKALSVYENQHGFSELTGLSTTLKEVCNTNKIDPEDCPEDMVDLSDMKTKGILSTVPVDPDAEGDGTGYWIAETQSGNEPMVVPALYQDNCPEGYISVPGNSYYHTLPGFCVMKWEAKCGESDGSIDCDNATDTPVSTEANRPWTNIPMDSSSPDAKQACSRANAHLITNNEWMTITRNAEAIDENWTGPTGVGDGSLVRGNSDSGCAWNDYACGALDGSDSLSEINTRTHTLTNGEVIWDMAGNVWNWTDENEPDKDKRPSPQGQFSTITISSWGSYSRDLIGPSNSTWDTSKGVGYYYVIYDDTLRGAFLRGGSWSFGSGAGLFTLHLNYSPTHTSTGIGFRCAR
jgi:prepilin-type N-terminal cleavage/methylation domain-containing protein